MNSLRQTTAKNQHPSVKEVHRCRLPVAPPRKESKEIERRDFPNCRNGNCEREEKEKAEKGSPSPGDKNSSTPSSVALNVRFLTPERHNKLKNVKKHENKLTEIEEIETKAMATINHNLSCVIIQVSNDMWTFASDCECADDEEEIFFMRNQVNHNSVGPAIANEITNNFLNNPINADLTGRVYNRDMGGDVNCLLSRNKKVRACSEIFAFCKKKFKFLTLCQTST